MVALGGWTFAVELSKVTAQGSIHNIGEQTPLCRNVRVYGPETMVLRDVVARDVAVRWLEEPTKYPTPAPAKSAATSRTAMAPFLMPQRVA